MVPAVTRRGTPFLARRGDLVPPAASSRRLRKGIVAHGSRMSRGVKVALGIPLAVVVAVGVAVAVSSGFHGVVIYSYFAATALGVAFLVARGGWIEEWSRSRFWNRPGSQ